MHNRIPAGDPPLGELLQDALGAVRKNLGMEVAFISEFGNDRRYFRYVDAEATFCPIRVGGSDPLDQSYCHRVAQGLLPELLPNAQDNKEALKIAATTQLPVGAHLSAPIISLSGDVFGTVCCFSRQANYRLDARDLDILHLYADFVGKTMSRVRERRRATEEAEARIWAAIKQDAYHIVYQPIVQVSDRNVAGYEALTRFAATPIRSPDKWFSEALAVGLNEELEIAAIRSALEALPHFPDDAYLSINASPETILGGGLPHALEVLPAGAPRARGH
jgi:hypothetical protein